MPRRGASWWILGAVVQAAAAPAPYALYWGDVHGHTEASDGSGSIRAFFTYARDEAKLDFVIVTDHDFGNAPPWRMPADTWRKAQEEADAFTRDGQFVAVAGYEWTSQPKYWAGVTGASERLFPGPPRYYNHKNVYFPRRMESLFSAKDPAFHTPDLLAEAVGRYGGLIHNNHPGPGDESRDQFDYSASNTAVIANTEMRPDVVRYRGTAFAVNGEQTVRAFLARGGRTGFVGATDTHEGKPAARTAVLAGELSRAGLFDALRHRRCYAVTGARIVLDFRIGGQVMGGETETASAPRIVADAHGTDCIEELVLVRDGLALRTIRPGARDVHFEFEDAAFQDRASYYVRVTQADRDEDGNLSQAWSSPIWVTRSDGRSR